MIEYRFNLQLKKSQESYPYCLTLNPSDENNPASFFTPLEQEKLRTYFQEQSLCQIDEEHLHKIINTWIQDIEEGYRESSISLDLPSMLESDISKLKESGNQSIPYPIYPDLSDIAPTFGMLPSLNF